jgi:hypothetical protein
VSVDGDRKAMMTDDVFSCGREQRRLEKTGKIEWTVNMLDVEKRGVCDSWRDRGYCNWILKRRP